MDSPKILLFSFLALGAVNHAAQQIDPTIRRGPASRFASGMSLDPASRPKQGGQPGPDYVYLRPPTESLATAPWTPSTPVQVGDPDYSLNALFPGHWSTIEIDAHSTGNALIPPIDAQGGLILSGGSFANRWFGLALSVTNASVGTQGSLLEKLRKRTPGGRTVGADVICHYWKGSVGLASSVAGKTVLEQLRGDLGFSNGEELDAFDFALGVQYFTPRLASRVFFLETGKYYFSVSRAWASSPAAKNFLPTGAPDPAAIYRIDWNGATRRWSTPVVHYSRADLGLTPISQPGGELEDVDAIAVQATGAVIFSTQTVVGRPQIQIHHLGVLSGPLPLMASATVSADAAAGLAEGDEVDGLCGWDPEPYSGYGNMVGSPTEDLWGPGLGAAAGLSMTRWRQVDTNGVVVKDSLIFELSGWGPARPSASLGLIYATAAPPGPSFRPPQSFVYAGSFARRPSDETVQFSFDIAPTLMGNAGFGVALFDAATLSMLARTTVTDFQL